MQVSCLHIYIISLIKWFDISHITFELNKRTKEQILLSEFHNYTIETEFTRRKIYICIAYSCYDVDIGDSPQNLEHKPRESKKNIPLYQLKVYFVNTTYPIPIGYYSSNLIDIIQNMRNDVLEIDLDSYQQKKLTKNNLLLEMVNIHNQKAILEKTVVDIQRENSEFRSLISELSSASKFISDLENIRSMVFNRDGIVSSSLRTRALTLISAKASEYINIFNVGLSRITLIEKPREIKVLCYGKRGEIDTISLSGGEKVAVSLAIRMGIAFLMGSSKIDFIVLDEPTTNFDEEDVDHL